MKKKKPSKYFFLLLLHRNKFHLAQWICKKKQSAWHSNHPQGRQHQERKIEKIAILREDIRRQNNQRFFSLLLFTVSGILSSATQYTNYYLHYDYIGKDD